MKAKPQLLILILIIPLISACYSQPPVKKHKWQVAFKHSSEGEKLAGSKKLLFAAIRAGKTVRIGWGWYNKERELSIEHLAEPIWLAIVDQKEVIAHLEPQVLSAIDWANGTANYEDEALLDQEWRVVINTNGSFDAVWYNRKTSERTRRLPQHHTITWFVDELAPKDTKALFETE